MCGDVPPNGWVTFLNGKVAYCNFVGKKAGSQLEGEKPTNLQLGPNFVVVLSNSSVVSLFYHVLSDIRGLL